MAYNPPTQTVIDNDLKNAPSNEAVYEALATKQPTGNYITALTSDVTATGPGSVAATISNSAVTNAKMANMANNTIKGNVSGSAAAPSDLSRTQVTAFLNTFTSLLQGAVPASGGGTTNFLRADGTWAAAGVSTSSGDVYKVLASNGTTTTWQYSGLGDGSFGTNNVILGQGKPTNLTGTSNSLLGKSVAINATTATENVIIGYAAGSPNSYGNGPGITTGTQNILIGLNAGTSWFYNQSLTSSDNSIGLGVNALPLTSRSIAIGTQAKASHQSATQQAYQIAIGYNAQAGNENYGGGTTVGNIAIGANSQAYGTESCTVIGTSASAAYPSTNSVVVGKSANVGSSANSVIIGGNSGTGNLTGAQNLIIGAASGTSLTSGIQNVILGSAIGTAYSTGSYNVTIGNNIFDDNSSYSINIGSQVGPQNNSNTINIGRYQSTYGSYSVNIGHYSAVGANSVVMGYGQRMYGTNNVALGVSSQKYQNGQYMVSVGAYAGGGSLTSDNYSSFNNSVYLGAYAGSYSNGVSNEFFVDNQDRSSYVNQQQRAMLYGTFNSTASSQTLTTNSQFTATYGITVSTAGYGLTVKGGTNAKIGTVAMPATNPNTVTVSTTAVTANSIIFLTPQTQDGGLANPLVISSKTAGTSFDITTKDTSYAGTVGWMIVEKS